MLILHIGSGKDHFIMLSGEFARTCFAQSFSQLARSPVPVRDMTARTKILDEGKALTAPRELMRIINWLMSNALDVDALFVKHGNIETCRTLREALDTGSDFPSPPNREAEVDLALSIGETLLQFLSSTMETEPIIPFELYELCGRAENRDEAFEIIEQLSGVSANVLISLTAFLHFFLQAPSQPNSRRSPSILASVFAPVLLPDQADALVGGARLTPLVKRNYLLYFIC